MSEDSGQYVNDIASHPSFERIRGEILGIVDYRAQEAQAAFAGLTTFCGVVYTGSTIAILGFIGTQVERGIPLLAIASFACFALALIAFAIFYQIHSQLMARRYERFAVGAQEFFLREKSFQELLALNQQDRSKNLYRNIFWVPLVLALIGFALGIGSVSGLGPVLSPLAGHQSEGSG